MLSFRTLVIALATRRRLKKKVQKDSRLVKARKLPPSRLYTHVFASIDRKKKPAKSTGYALPSNVRFHFILFFLLFFSSLKHQQCSQLKEVPRMRTAYIKRKERVDYHVCSTCFSLSLSLVARPAAKVPITFTLLLRSAVASWLPLDN